MHIAKELRHFETCTSNECAVNTEFIFLLFLIKSLNMRSALRYSFLSYLSIRFWISLSSVLSHKCVGRTLQFFHFTIFNISFSFSFKNFLNNFSSIIVVCTLLLYLSPFTLSFENSDKNVCISDFTSCIDFSKASSNFFGSSLVFVLNSFCIEYNGSLDEFISSLGLVRVPDFSSPILLSFISLKCLPTF